MKGIFAIMKFLYKLKAKKGFTGADVAAAITIIVLTIGIVTAIYVNTINKSKDNLRFANATRIATNIMENIQKNPYELLLDVCKNENTCEKTGGNKLFDTKIPNGFKAKVTISGAEANKPDIARDIIVSVTYKTSTTYKTISLKSVKEKELMDISNNPDISLISGYNPSLNSTYYYPVKKVSSEYKVTTKSDIDWYDYEEGNYALVCATSTSDANVGDTVSGIIYAWIPRFVSKNSGVVGLSKIQFLYGASNYIITMNTYGDLFAYGVSYKNGNIQSGLNEFDSEFAYTSFAENDGLSGVWYQVGGTNTIRVGKSEHTIQEIATDFTTKTGFVLPN